MHVEYNEFKIAFEGNPDEVTMAFINFINKIFPSYELARRLVFQPDLVKLSRMLKGVIEYSKEGLILISSELNSEEAILLSLLGVYVGNKLGLLTDACISVNEIANVSGKASKTILNQLKVIIDNGYAERVGRGEYKIKMTGIKVAEKMLKNLKMREKK